MTHFFEVVVLSTHAQALLRIANSFITGNAISQKPILELIHTRIGKHEGRVILYDHGSRRNNRVLFGRKEIKKGLSYLF
jgi:hypothetical protein